MNSDNSTLQPPLQPPFQERRQEQWVIVAQGGYEYTMNNSLVLSAVDIEHQVNLHSGKILVREEESEKALFELQTFAEENQDWPPAPDHIPPLPRTDNPPTLLMIGGLIIFYIITGPWISSNPWFQAGAVNSRAILEQGQWWRLITALTLHADQMHLVGNSVIGGFMVHLLCRITGYGMGWLSLILSGAAGNLMNIVLRHNAHYSVGFSTAIFGAIGIFCGLQLFTRRSSIIRQLILPLGAGAGLLAMLGTGDGRTDLGAHLFGFGCGIVYGLLLRVSGLDLQADNRRLQRILFLTAVCLVAICWWSASGGK